MVLYKVWRNSQKACLCIYRKDIVIQIVDIFANSSLLVTYIINIYYNKSYHYLNIFHTNVIYVSQFLTIVNYLIALSCLATGTNITRFFTCSMQVLMPVSLQDREPPWSAARAEIWFNVLKIPALVCYNIVLLQHLSNM